MLSVATTTTTTTTNVLIIVTLHKVAVELYISDLKNDGSRWLYVPVSLRCRCSAVVEGGRPSRLDFPGQSCISGTCPGFTSVLNSTFSDLSLENTQDPGEGSICSRNRTSSVKLI